MARFLGFLKVFRYQSINEARENTQYFINLFDFFSFLQ